MPFFCPIVIIKYFQWAWAWGEGNCVRIYPLYGLALVLRSARSCVTHSSRFSSGLRRVFSSSFILALYGKPASRPFPHDCSFVLWSRSGGPLYLGAPFFPGLSGVEHCSIFLPRDPY